MCHLETNNILYPLQHGFGKNRCCESQLFEFITDLIDTLANTKQTRLIIMEFSKALYKVFHNWLLLKRKCYRHQLLSYPQTANRSHQITRFNFFFLAKGTLTRLHKILYT